ncbi:hypothetical protein HLK59_03255 [Streptomyces sp. S3(2020)]|uniref:hypothetical protein n=1 Tax=Streptomyces sp. S3(2020) TaxID=2732044 RepID=UPI001488AFC5|nr:hypothetical protein [Streptomyces sp. S3(2020)]NNN29387.1 hypothetical protein [Streptomyces sp. S3(2020)]
MEPVVFEHGIVHLRVDRGVFELFRRGNTIGPYRAPLDWVKVRTEARRRDVTRLYFGYVDQADEPIYASSTPSGPVFATVDIPTADEPLYRAHFTRLARLSDRLVSK